MSNVGKLYPANSIRVAGISGYIHQRNDRAQVSVHFPQPISAIDLDLKDAALLADCIKSILFTPSGRPRRRISDAKMARLDKLMAQAKPLKREASRLVLEAA